MSCDEQPSIATLQARITELEQQLSQERRNRADDRTGRTRAEAQLRDTLLRAMPAGVGALKPIGFARSVFRDRRGTPRQGCLAPAAVAKLELAPSVQARDSLLGLHEFSHLWLIFVFHQNTNTQVLLNDLKNVDVASAADPALPVWCSAQAPEHFPNIRFKIAAPRLKGDKVGVFATRSPHRPNPIGLTLASIVSIHADANPPYILLGGADLVDGTPVLDIKPFVPHYDIATNVRLPQWIDEQTPSFARVRFADACLMQFNQLPLSLFPDSQRLIAAVQQILINDIRSNHQQNKTAASAATIGQSDSSSTHTSLKRKESPGDSDRPTKLEKRMSNVSVVAESALTWNAEAEPLPTDAVLTEYLFRLDTVEFVYVVVDAWNEVLVLRASAIADDSTVEEAPL